MADQPVRAELADRRFGVAEIDRDHRDAGGRAVSMSVAGIPHHHRARRRRRRPPDGPPQDLRVGLLNAEGVLAADRGKAPGQAERIEQQPRQAFELVGADREAAAAAARRSSAASRPGNGCERSAIWAA